MENRVYLVVQFNCMTGTVRDYAIMIFPKGFSCESPHTGIRYACLTWVDGPNQHTAMLAMSALLKTPEWDWVRPNISNWGALG